MAESGIYEIVNRVNGKRYVGSAVSLHKRWREHRSDLRRGVHHSHALQRAWIKYGETSFSFTALVHCGRDHLIEEEQKAFDLLRPEYNTCKVAGSMMGVSPSPETRKKLSLALKYREFTEEHRQNISAALAAKRAQGWGLSPETRKRIAAKKLGSKASPETRAKMSAARKGRRVLPVGFKHSKETRAAQSLRMQANPTFLGKVHTAEAKAKISAIQKARFSEASAIDAMRAMLQRPEVKAKKSANMMGNQIWLGRSHSEATKEKIRAVFVGRTFSEETRKRMSEAQRRKAPPSLETRAKMSASRSGTRNGSTIRRAYTIENAEGQQLSGLPIELRRMTGISPAGMTQLIHGQQKSAKGWALVASA